MLRLSPILIAVLVGFGMYWFSAFRLRKTLSAQSVELVDPRLNPVLSKMAQALDVEKIKVHRYEIDTVNGLAAPDGRIFITRGLYDKFRSGEITAQELASVIAHELGHIALALRAHDRFLEPKRHPRRPHDGDLTLYSLDRAMDCQYACEYAVSKIIALGRI